MENFLRGHVAAFEAWQGVPRVLLYDNLKMGLERRGDAIRFIDLARLRWTLSLRSPPGGGGARERKSRRVERAIRYVRDGLRGPYVRRSR